MNLGSQGAVALTNKWLVEELKTLFEAFIKLIATAIDKKSEHTGDIAKESQKLQWC